MPTVAEQLRTGRDARKMTVEQVAEITKIRGDHIRALEEGNYDAFIAPVYIRGFVRTYATVLKLEVASVMSVLDRELGQTSKFSEPPALGDGPKGFVDTLMLQLSRMDWRTGVALAALLFVCIVSGTAYYLYRGYKKADPAAGIKPALYRSADTNSGELLPLPAPAAKR